MSGFIIGSTGLAAPLDDEVPVAPLPAIAFQGWTNAYRLQNDSLDVVVAPEIGRIVHLGPAGGRNLFHLDASLTGRTATVEAPDHWFNFGGDWLWPVAQSHWKDFQAGDWPPSRLLDGRPWTAQAWTCADGAQCCTLNQEYGPPLNVKVSRHLKLARTGASLVIHQRIERTSESAIPVTLWNISQLARPQRLVMPVDAKSAFSNSYAVLNFAPPDDTVLAACPESLIYRADAGGEHKLGSDSGRAWLAASLADAATSFVLIEHAESAAELKTRLPAGYPDGGCRVEFYSNTGLGYSEIETLSQEKILAPGESLENTLTVSLYRLSAPLDDCALAGKVRMLLGEKSE